MNTRNYLFKRVVCPRRANLCRDLLVCNPERKTRRPKYRREVVYFFAVLAVCIHAHSIHSEAHEHSQLTLPHIKSNIFFCVHFGWRWVQTFCLYWCSFCLPPIWHIVILLILDCFIWILNKDNLTHWWERCIKVLQ